VYPLEILNIARRRTKTPVNLKNRLANVPERKEVSPPTPRSQGAVPSANAIIVRAPVMKLPVVIAYACMASVKPQGRKKVRAPEPRAVICFETPPLFATQALRNFGRVMDIRESLGERSERLIPRRSIMSPVAMVSTPIVN